MIPQNLKSFHETYARAASREFNTLAIAAYLTHQRDVDPEMPNYGAIVLQITGQAMTLEAELRSQMTEFSRHCTHETLVDAKAMADDAEGQDSELLDVYRLAVAMHCHQHQFIQSIARIYKLDGGELE